MTRSVGYCRVYTDENNVTRFEDLEWDAVPAEYAPPAPPVFVTEAMQAGSVMFLSVPKGWTDLAHPAPARQIVLLLSGEAMGSAGGEERRFCAGDIALVEDTSGPGHGLTALTDLVIAVVRL